MSTPKTIHAAGVKKHCVIVCGPEISRDERVVGELQKSALVLNNPDLITVEAAVARVRADLLLLEISQIDLHGIEIIKRLKSRYPRMQIIIVDGDGNREVVAQAFHYGATDAFRKPYNSALLVERVRALLRSQ